MKGNAEETHRTPTVSLYAQYEVNARTIEFPQLTNILRLIAL